MSNYEPFRELESRGVDIVELLSGDRSLGPDDFLELVNRVDRAGDDLYSDLLHLLTHHRYPPATAASLWRGILRHKEKLEKQLGRNPGVRIAAADYLTNIRPTVDRPRLVGREDFETVLRHVTIDSLTSLSNRRHILDRYESELRRSRRYSKDFSILLVDFDRFKEVNDTYGHAAGDRVLVEVARRLVETCRETDAVGRTGGDELLILLPETRGADGLALADRLRRAISDEPVVIDEEGTTVPMSISVGLATFPEDGRDAESLLARADEALYRSKRGGRDSVSAAERTPRDDAAPGPRREGGGAA